MNNLIKLKQVCNMTEEQIERLKDDLRKYTLCYDWHGYDYVKKIFADNKEEWIKFLQREWGNKSQWFYKTENLSILTKLMCIISRYIPRNGYISTVKDYLYDLNEQLINIRNNIESSRPVADHMRYFKHKYLGLHSPYEDDFEKLILDVRDMILPNEQKRLNNLELRRLDYKFLILGYDSIHNYEDIACYVFNKVEQYNKQKLEEQRT